MLVIVASGASAADFQIGKELRKVVPYLLMMFYLTDAWISERIGSGRLGGSAVTGAEIADYCVGGGEKSHLWLRCWKDIASDLVTHLQHYLLTATW